MAICVMSALVTVNIGGVLHTACTSTLRKAPFFDRLLEHTERGAIQTTRDAEGRIYVDRPGASFGVLLGGQTPSRNCKIAFVPGGPSGHPPDPPCFLN